MKQHTNIEYKCMRGLLLESMNEQVKVNFYLKHPLLLPGKQYCDSKGVHFKCSNGGKMS